MAPTASTAEFAAWLAAAEGISVDRIAGVHSPVISVVELKAVLGD